MRTTISIDEHLLKQAKDRARADHQTLGEFVEDAVRQRLLSRTVDAGVPVVPVFRRGTGLAPGIEPSSNTSMLDATDED